MDEVSLSGSHPPCPCLVTFPDSLQKGFSPIRLRRPAASTCSTNDSHAQPRSTCRGLYHLPQWYNQNTMLQDLNPPVLIARILTLIVAFTIHEFAHAWTAEQLGDGTPRLNGRLTLNPLAHLDIFGSLLLLLTGFGYAKPVPVNPYALRRRTPAGMMLVAAAGPLSNLLLAILAAIPFKLGLISLNYSIGTFLPNISFLLQEFVFINLILLFFNLIPIYPLDGEKVAEYFLPPSGQDTLMRIRPYGPMILMALLFLLPMTGFNLFTYLVGWPANRIYTLLIR